MITPLSPLAFLARSAEVFGDKTAIVSAERRLTYRAFAAEATRVAHALRASGIEPGDRVAYLSPNLPELLIAHFAVPLAGAVLVAVNTRLSPEEIAYILDHSGSRLMVVHETLVDRLIPAEGRTTVVIGTAREGALSYDDLLARGSDEPLPWSVDDENATISINYTSGTTARPKGVEYTHRGAYLNALGEIIHSSHSPESVYLWTLPMFHCNGWCTTWAVTAIGGTHVCLPSVDGTEIWRLIDAEGVTHLNAAPTVLVTIANAEQAHPLTRPLVATTAGAPPSPTIIGEMRRLGVRVVHLYGLTETYGPYAVCEPQAGWPADGPERARLTARQGVGMLQTDGLRVVDESMTDVPRDGATMGEIVMRGNNVMAGYFADPDATERAFRGGWFHSGDLGVVHPDGYVELRDRAKDVIISGGENISTVEVEQAVASHPAVLETAVVGVPDERWGERPKAFVILRVGASATEADIVAHVRAHLAGFKAPDRVEFVTELPKTSTGKIQKFVLKNKEWAGSDRRIQG
ncbi:Long-chain-fatty-acid--CoA ligase [Actinomadura rubteroloni]|uniref:Long-chain-fatty-acid--CoA ligase n=1 Tax=Actinomadura rubteroloni TaxID=1926885 RepID=A0A2P4UQK7_9ACTN|nr:acyl--CoA ligase family protein [Actinomadura rubteroloni]POM27333.1 Long-chain-fatty-acid--CoA ligase [Actinomadura rubteroloni]